MLDDAGQVANCRRQLVVEEVEEGAGRETACWHGVLELDRVVKDGLDYCPGPCVCGLWVLWFEALAGNETRRRVVRNPPPMKLQNVSPRSE